MELTYTQQFAYEIQENSAVIWRCFSRTKTAEIPENIEGYPVTALAPYAFSAHMDERELEGKKYTMPGQEHRPDGVSAASSEEHSEKEAPVLREKEDMSALCGENLEEVILPESLVKVGRYCFYNCQNLKKITFSGALRDWGSGAFTGCHKVDHLAVTMKAVEESTLKEVLQELPEEMQVDYCYETGGEKHYARLIFPEFFEEGVENTPARILVTHVHGSGLYYRNCFRHRTFNFAEYDCRFPYAAVQESFRLLAAMVEGRLRFPYKLSGEARERYMGYLLEKKEAFGRYFVEKKDGKALSWFVETLFNQEKVLMTGEQRVSAEASAPENQNLLEQMTELAARLHFLEGVSYLMDCRHRYFKPRKKSFDL